MFDFAITGSRRSLKRRTNSRMKILSSACVLVRWIGTRVQLSVGRTLGLALVEFASGATLGFETLTFNAGSGFAFGMNLKIYPMKSREKKQ